MKRNLLEYVLAVVTLLCVMLWAAIVVALFGQWLEKEPKSVRYTTGDMVFANAVSVQTNLLTIQNGGRSLVTVNLDGTVTLGEGVSTNEAARVFWDAVARMAGHRCPGSNGVTWPEVEQ